MGHSIETYAVWALRLHCFGIVGTTPHWDSLPVPDRKERVLRRSASRQLRGRVFKAADGRCHYCRDEIDPFSNWQLDHKTPLSKGGGDHEENIVASCHLCNRRKGSRTAVEFLAAMARRRERLVQTAASE